VISTAVFAPISDVNKTKFLRTRPLITRPRPK